MTDDEFRNIYTAQIAEAEEYQDFVADQLRKCTPCIIVAPYTSRKYQYEHGESASGIEIKFDKLCQDTGNLYIEVAEKTKPSVTEWTPSGIMRDDNSWLYLIGNYAEAFLFHKKQLQKLYLTQSIWSKRGIRKAENKTHTSQGFILPVWSAEEYGTVLRRFRFD